MRWSKITRKTIAEWQQKQTLIKDPECDQNVREAIQDDANLIATHAKLQEQEMKHFRARMEAYLKEIKGEPNEAGNTLLSAFDQRAKKRSLRLLFDEGGGIPKKARDRSGHDSNGEGRSEDLDEIQLLSIELFRAVRKGDHDLARNPRC